MGWSYTSMAWSVKQTGSLMLPWFPGNARSWHTNQWKNHSTPRALIIVLRKSFDIYMFQQTSRYGQGVPIYKAAQDVKMSAKTIPYLHVTRDGNNFWLKRLSQTSVTQPGITNSIRVCTVKKKKFIYIKSNVPLNGETQILYICTLYIHIAQKHVWIQSIHI